MEALQSLSWWQYPIVALAVIGGCAVVDVVGGLVAGLRGPKRDKNDKHKGA